MSLTLLTSRDPIDAYERQAAEVLTAWSAGHQNAIDLVRRAHPRFRDPAIPWKVLDVPDEAIREADLTADDARLAVARAYDFADWASLVELVAACADPTSPVARFERAVEAVIDGDEPSLAALLQHDPAIVRARSTRRTCLDPSEHRATLLHYVAANGTEGYRQRTPPNAVDVARRLLDAGAEPDATAGLYGGQCVTMTMLVSSSHPAEAGLQVPLVHLLADYGASVNPIGDGPWNSPLMTALVFGFLDAADALVRRGASIDSIVPAAGLGRADDVRMWLPTSDEGERHRALVLAVQNGQAEVVRVLLEAGVAPDRFNPDGFHAHATPLHHAALAGREDIARLLIDHGAGLDVRDHIWNSTPLGWALHNGQASMAAFLGARAGIGAGPRERKGGPDAT